MKKQWKGFLAGLLVAMLASSIVTPALGALAGKTIQVFTGVDVYVNDVKVEPKDANGNPVEVFVYNGTTYLPIRAIGNALGMPVQWEGKTNSAYVGKHQGDKPAVWLKDLDYFYRSPSNKEFLSTENGKDNTGTTYQTSIYPSFNSYTVPTTSYTYKLNGQYSAISGVFYQRYEYRSSEHKTTLKIYGDNDLLYTASVEAGVNPIDFYVNLQGILELKVVFEAEYYSVDSESLVSIGNCGLWS